MSIRKFADPGIANFEPSANLHEVSSGEPPEATTWSVTK